MDLMETIPKGMRAGYQEITRVTDDFCREFLNEEYALVCRHIAAAMCRKRPSPLAQGNLTHWVVGIIHSAGWVNFLWDPSQVPYMRASEISERFGISNSTAAARSRVIQQALKLIQLDPRYCLPGKLADNPLAWLLEIDGIIVDARMLPRPAQEELARRGLIPFVPEPAAARPQERPAKASAAPAKKKSPPGHERCQATRRTADAGKRGRGTREPASGS